MKLVTPFSAGALTDRVLTIKRMHDLVLLLDNEHYYVNMWILIVPDEPDNSDFEYIANDEDLYNATVAMFFSIMEKARKENK